MAEQFLKASRFTSFASATSLLTVVSCYGTLAVVALLSVVGVTVHVNEEMMARILTIVLAVALVGMLYSYRLYRDIRPFLLGAVSAALLLWVFYGEDSRLLEGLGFVGLVSASVWDLRAKHRACPVHRTEGNPACL